jgi:hypothetical protein
MPMQPAQPKPLPHGSVMTSDAFDEGVSGWHVDWRDGKSVRGFVPNRGPSWWRLAVGHMHHGATVIEERKTVASLEVSASR